VNRSIDQGGKAGDVADWRTRNGNRSREKRRSV